MAMERINLNYDKFTGRFGHLYLMVTDSANGVNGPSLEVSDDHCGTLHVGCGTKDVMVKCGRDWYVLRTVRHLGEKHDYRLTISKVADEKTGRRESFGVINYKGHLVIDRQFVEHFKEEAAVYDKVWSLRHGVSCCNFNQAVL